MKVPIRNEGRKTLEAHMRTVFMGHVFNFAATMETCRAEISILYDQPKTEENRIRKVTDAL